jgi:hypothetical protein
MAHGRQQPTACNSCPNRSPAHKERPLSSVVLICFPGSAVPAQGALVVVVHVEGGVMVRSLRCVEPTMQSCRSAQVASAVLSTGWLAVYGFEANAGSRRAALTRPDPARCGRALTGAVPRPGIVISAVITGVVGAGHLLRQSRNRWCMLMVSYA